ncbi:hypothetical protein PCL_07415 [Purpureocillium lilacinum]|uniref:Chromo shadow domain-containing protein n=1 Tax=Purpureocillium lilacinum TaxID=33203 RepID=A0A2U3DS86_PURLI|nr:hypothetical protein PCL_07415 [Purpureocillium lilacinum]
MAEPTAAQEGRDALAENEYYVERIQKYKVTNDGDLWFSKPTWEPEENLRNCSVLHDYFYQKGGREGLLQKKPQRTAMEKLRGRKPRGRDHRGGEPGGEVSARRKDKRPSTNAKAWSPPAGSWEDEIESITGFDEEDGGKRRVYITWKNGEKTKHPTDVAHTKFPQKMLEWYERHVVIVRDTGAKCPAELEYRAPGQTGNN